MYLDLEFIRIEEKIDIVNTRRICILVMDINLLLLNHDSTFIVVLDIITLSKLFQRAG